MSERTRRRAREAPSARGARPAGRWLKGAAPRSPFEVQVCICGGLGGGLALRGGELGGGLGEGGGGAGTRLGPVGAPTVHVGSYVGELLSVSHVSRGGGGLGGGAVVSAGGGVAGGDKDGGLGGLGGGEQLVALTYELTQSAAPLTQQS
jgi:hypothetical protein